MSLSPEIERIANNLPPPLIKNEGQDSFEQETIQAFHQDVARLDSLLGIKANISDSVSNPLSAENNPQLSVTQGDIILRDLQDFKKIVPLPAKLAYDSSSYG
ncbi:MAG: hypothetical protein A2007_02020 [Verrucomicrobia bacterium GWC2_42_7]|nr:MAG: hypothetical protein A2007_02020 [Verrucomicrobia bacterium GWC2_42_7]